MTQLMLYLLQVFINYGELHTPDEMITHYGFVDAIATRGVEEPFSVSMAVFLKGLPSPRPFQTFPAWHI